KKQALSCYFCRERKIACGRPDDGTGRAARASDQCTRRKLACTYPTVSHRGQHSRIKSAVRKGLVAGAGVGASDRGEGGARERRECIGVSVSARYDREGSGSPPMRGADREMHMEDVEWERDRDRERAGMEEAETRMAMALSASPTFGGIMNDRERAMGRERGGP
ncbi:hypothetical protein B0H19DRAFT_965158, partial [Mycena capillaripes]